MTRWNHDDVVRLLRRETAWRHDQIERMVIHLAALGWTQHQVRRGITSVARTGLSFDSLWRGAELAGGDIDGFLDSLAASRRAGE